MAVSRLGYFTVENILSSINKEKCISKLVAPQTKAPQFKVKQGVQYAAVLVPMCIDKGELSLLYLKRSMNMTSHKGQVAFPGGKRDLEDSSLTHTALRETEEELGIPTSSVEIWTEGQSLPGRNFEMLITPVIGFIKDFNSIPIKMCEAEVDDYFTVSLEKLTDPQNLDTETFKNGWTLPVFNGGKHKIWGVTALITQMFLASLLPEEIYSIKNQKLKFPDKPASKL